MNQTRFYLLVEVGPAKGQRHFIPDNGAKLGRSSANDICIVDPQLSRQHCAFELRDGHLWIKDLASANFTLVNDAQITEQLLRPGDRVQAGETVLRVVSEDAPNTHASLIPGVTVAAANPPPAPIITIPAPDEPPRADAPRPAPAPTQPVIDLGLSKKAEPGANKPNTLRMALYLVAALAVLALGVVGIDMLSKPETVQQPEKKEEDRTLQFEYEKIDYTPENIFRLHLALTPGGMLTGQAHDIARNRSFNKELQLQPHDVSRLLGDIGKADGVKRFMALNREYDGRNPNPNTMTEYTLTLVVGKQARKSVVRNRAELPPDFKGVLDAIENFAEIELKIKDIMRPTEELIALAEDSLAVADTLVREASQRLENLWNAIKNYKDAEAYLDSVNPKPEFYPEIISGRDAAQKQLEAEYNELSFSANHANRTENWPLFQRHLQSIKRLIPDENDQRHKDANRQLISVEAKLKK